MLILGKMGLQALDTVQAFRGELVLIYRVVRVAVEPVHGGRAVVALKRIDAFARLDPVS